MWIKALEIGLKVLNFVLSILEIIYSITFAGIALAYSASSNSGPIVFEFSLLAVLMMIQAVLNFTQANKVLKYIINIFLIIIILCYSHAGMIGMDIIIMLIIMMIVNFVTILVMQNKK